MVKFFGEKPAQLRKYGARVERKAPERLQALKERLLEIPSQEEGIDIEGITRFFSDLGLGTADLRFIWDESVDDVAKLFQDYPDFEGTQQFLRATSPTRATYIPALETVVVKRNRGLEQINGIRYTEGLAVHELAHSTARVNRFLVTDASFVSGDTEDAALVLRTGFKHHSPSRKIDGTFFEEGFAEYMRGKFLAQNVSDEEQLEHARRLTLAIPNFNPSQYLSRLSASNDLPKERYLYIGEDGQVEYLISTFAGVAFDLLITNTPGLEEVLKEARVSTNGLKQFARLIDSKQRGLYQKLRQLGYNERDFIQGLHAVKEALAKT